MTSREERRNRLSLPMLVVAVDRKTNKHRKKKTERRPPFGSRVPAQEATRCRRAATRGSVFNIMLSKKKAKARKHHGKRKHNSATYTQREIQD